MATPVTGWLDGAGALPTTEISANRADARRHLDNFFSLAVSGYDFDVDLDMIISNRAAIIAALQTFED
jgi:hypothetical protein